ncbi:MAG: FeoA family protein [Bythopirellula sp.]|nr:FeoA family protein [Bythopirellula sp.]
MIDLHPLSLLRAGDLAEVQSVMGSAELVRHLAEIGLRLGTRLEMIRPGTTCILRIEGAKLCVRCDELLRILVSPLPATGHSAPAVRQSA